MKRSMLRFKMENASRWKACQSRFGRDSCYMEVAGESVEFSWYPSAFSLGTRYWSTYCCYAQPSLCVSRSASTLSLRSDFFLRSLAGKCSLFSLGYAFSSGSGVSSSPRESPHQPHLLFLFLTFESQPPVSFSLYCFFSTSHDRDRQSRFFLTPYFFFSPLLPFHSHNSAA